MWYFRAVLDQQHIDTEEVVLVPLAELRKRDQRIAQLSFELEQLRRLVFGAKSERNVPAVVIPEQQVLFATEQDAVTQEQELVNVPAHTRVKNKKKPVRTAIPAHIPRIDHVIEPENLPDGATRIGEEITEQLHYSPAVFSVDRYIRRKYIVDGQVLIAPMPSLAFPKSDLGPTLAAQICVSKFCDHLPLYRQVQIYKRAGLNTSDSTLGDWFAATATLLHPLGQVLRNTVLAEKYLQADESPIPVQYNHKKEAPRKGFQWVYYAPLIKTVLFDYQRGRSAEFPKDMLKEYQGALQTDGYAGYEKIVARDGMLGLACMAHARRKFEKALDNDKVRSEYALGKIRELYQIERNCADRFSETGKADHELRHRYRRLYACPILLDLEQWIKQEIMLVAPKSPIGAAFAYALHRWPRLCAYTKDGLYQIDNNAIENTIRPFAIGRKNYLFAGSDKGAQHAALLYSLLGTCKLQGIEPLAYLTDVITRISDHKANALQELLPQNWVPLAK